jgi:hypothetical protein
VSVHLVTTHGPVHIRPPGLAARCTLAIQHLLVSTVTWAQPMRIHGGELSSCIRLLSSAISRPMSGLSLAGVRNMTGSLRLVPTLVERRAYNGSARTSAVPRLWQRDCARVAVIFPGTFPRRGAGAVGSGRARHRQDRCACWVATLPSQILSQACVFMENSAADSEFRAVYTVTAPIEGVEGAVGSMCSPCTCEHPTVISQSAAAGLNRGDRAV